MDHSGGAAESEEHLQDRVTAVTTARNDWVRVRLPVLLAPLVIIHVSLYVYLTTGDDESGQQGRR